MTAVHKRGMSRITLWYLLCFEDKDGPANWMFSWIFEPIESRNAFYRREQCSGNEICDRDSRTHSPEINSIKSCRSIFKLPTGCISRISGTLNGSIQQPVNNNSLWINFLFLSTYESTLFTLKCLRNSLTKYLHVGFHPQSISIVCP